jgi:hypothetical protein
MKMVHQGPVCKSEELDKPYTGLIGNKITAFFV